VCLALPFAFAGVSAQAAGAMTFHPANATDLFNDVTTANSTPGFNVIDLADTTYLPSSTQSMTITGNLAITGPPQLQPSQFVGGVPPSINGQNQAAAGVPLFTIASGANVIFKAFNLESAGGTTWPNTLVNGGNLEVDNMSLDGNLGDAVDVSAVSTSNLRVINSLITSTGTASSAGITNNGAASQMLLVDDTIQGNSHLGIGGPFTGHNDVWGGNNPDCSVGFANTPNTSEDTDGTCVADYAGGVPNLGPGATNGGPTFTSAPGAGSDIMANAADPTWCERSDQRFFTGTSCVIGSYQPNYTLQADTAGPACTINYIHNSPTDHPQEMQVFAKDSGVAGEGADTVSNQTIELKGTTTTNGTVSFPTVPNTLFDAASPGSNLLEAPSGSAFPVTADKPSTDTTAGDTFWSFLATDWFGNATQCQ
jgi:hypothetical protein